MRQAAASEMVVRLLVLLFASSAIAACDGLIGSTPEPQADGGAAPKADDTTHYDPPPSTPPTSDEPSTADEPPPVPNSVTVNVGINRAIVPGYPGDACGSVARLLVIDAMAPGGASLGHEELDCSLGYNGFTWFDQAPGGYVATVQLFAVDDYGVRTAVTQPRIVRGDLVADQGAVLWADFTYLDFDTSFMGNLRWQVGWVSESQPDIEQSCGGALPAVAQQRITLRDDAGAVVNAWARGPDGFVRTDGSTPGACSSFSTSDALVVTGLRWGVYSVTVEGLDASGQVAYCERRPLFTASGDGIIFHVVAYAGACPAE